MAKGTGLLDPRATHDKTCVRTPNYETYIVDDLLHEHVGEVRACLELGAHAVQIDFTEGRLACKLDPSGELLTSFVRAPSPARSTSNWANTPTCPLTSSSSPRISEA